MIFALGDGSEGDEVRSLEAGADDYVAKRFSPEVLLAISESYSLETSGWMRRTTQPG